jgi:hypothetical protein
MREPELLAKKIFTINFKKDNPIDALDKQVVIIVKYFLTTFSDFGIQAVNYKVNNMLHGLNNCASVDTYFHT